MIFPDACKVVGVAESRLCENRRVYFLTRYLIVGSRDQTEVLEVGSDPNGSGMMREILTSDVLAEGDDVFWYPEKVQIHDRAALVRLACTTGKRCTIFTGHDEHVTFVLDPDMRVFLKVHLYDIVPPLPSLSAAITNLEDVGLFGHLSIVFDHHIRDIQDTRADIYPCRAAGFLRTLDRDQPSPGERVAGCATGAQLLDECYGGSYQREEICPLAAVGDEPFIARCCRTERGGFREFSGKFGVVVHWGATPYETFDAVNRLVKAWRESHP
jgi:hypothetical protein